MCQAKYMTHHSANERFPLLRFFALLLTLCLALPNPVYALRQLNAGMEENPPLVDELSRALTEPSTEAPLARTVAARVEEFKSMIPKVEGLLAAEHIQQVRVALEQDAVALRETRDLASLTATLEARMLQRGKDSLVRLEAKGRKIGKDYSPMRQARATSMSEAQEDLLELFEKITRLLSFQDSLEKQTAAAEHLITLFQLLLLQDEADLELPYVAHSLIHSRNVQTETKKLLKVSSVLQEAFDKETQFHPSSLL